MGRGEGRDGAGGGRKGVELETVQLDARKRVEERRSQGHGNRRAGAQQAAPRSNGVAWGRLLGQYSGRITHTRHVLGVAQRIGVSVRCEGKNGTEGNYSDRSYRMYPTWIDGYFQRRLGGWVNQGVNDTDGSRGGDWTVAGFHVV